MVVVEVVVVDGHRQVDQVVDHQGVDSKNNKTKTRGWEHSLFFFIGITVDTGGNK